MAIAPTGSTQRHVRLPFTGALRSIFLVTSQISREVFENLGQSDPMIGVTSLAVRSTIGVLFFSTRAAGRFFRTERSNGCEYSFTNHTGRDTSSYCSDEDGALELFGRITTNSSTELGSLPLLDQAKEIHRTMLICLNHGPRRALGWFSGAMPYNSSNPIFSGAFDITCPNSNGMKLTNTIVTEDYTQNFEITFTCQQGYPVGVVNSTLTFFSAENCNTAESTFYIYANSSETGVSGFINGNMQNCTGFDSAAVQAYLATSPVNATFDQGERCWILIPTPPSPSPSSSPSPFPSFSPSPYPSPTAHPPVPTPTTQPPIPTPTVQPPIPTPTTQPPVPVPTPTPTPQKNTDTIEWSDPMMIAIFVIAGIFFCAVTAGCCYCYNRKRGIVYIGTGPALARDNTSEPHEEAEAARKEAEAKARAAAKAASTANEAADQAKGAKNTGLAESNAQIAQAAAEAARRAADAADRDAITAEENAKKVKQEYSESAQTDATQARKAANAARDSAAQAEAAAAAIARPAESNSKAKKRQGKGELATDPLLINEAREEEFVTLWGEEDPSGPPPASPPVSDIELFNLCGGRRKKDK